MIKMSKKKVDKSKLFEKILAIALVVMTLVSVAGTCVYAIINLVNS